MSADNIIIILGTKRDFIEDGNSRINHQPVHTVYRVAEVTAWDNYHYYLSKQPYNVGAYLKECFGNSRVFLTLEEAFSEALKIEEALKSKGFPLEYGKSIVETENVFYGD